MFVLTRQARDERTERDAFSYINCCFLGFFCRTRGHDSHLEDERLRKRVRFYQCVACFNFWNSAQRGGVCSAAAAFALLLPRGSACCLTCVLVLSDLAFSLVLSCLALSDLVLSCLAFFLSLALSCPANATRAGCCDWSRPESRPI